MKNIVLKTILLLITFLGYSQQNQLWEGHFSYNSIKDISQSEKHVYAAAINAYFKKNLTTNELTNKTTIEGLSGETISQIYHSKALKKTLVGHENGLLIVVNDVDGSMLNVVDILNKPSVPPNKKRINHFMEHDGKIYISTDFGICVYDLNILQFGDTYYIGPGGANVEILQTAFYNGFIYAVANGYRIQKALITNPNIIDFNQWINITGGNWLSIDAMSNRLVVVSLGGVMYDVINDSFSVVTTFPQVPVDVRYSDGHLIVTTQGVIYLYNEQLVQTLQINGIPNITAKFTCATIIENTIYVGTQDHGLFSSSLSNPTAFTNITPNGLERNKVFAIQTFSNGVWAVYGDYNSTYNPHPLDSFGVSKFITGKKWESFPYSDLFDAKSITRIAVNPNNEGQVYFSSNYSGVLKFVNNVPTNIYNTSNSSLITVAGQPADDIRVNGSVFDESGNLWVTNSLVSKGLHVLKPNGQWQGYNLTSLVSPLSISYGRLTIDKNGTKWIATNFEGLVGFNEKYNNRCLRINDVVGEGNLPMADARVAAVDNKNKLWIGTVAGLRVMQSVDSFLSQSQLKTDPIIILENGVAQELLYQQFITDIVVDGANNKWIGTAGAGVFFVSPDGQKTFNVFTKDNSPLPSNVINDIDINGQTGEVFIATDSGILTYKGVSTKGADNLENIIAYPNPVRPEFNGSVAITGLMTKSTVKITDIEGNLVFEEISEGGTVMWDTKVFGKSKVASGVYMVFVSSEDGELTKVKKVMVVR